MPPTDKIQEGDSVFTGISNKNNYLDVKHDTVVFYSFIEPGVINFRVFLEEIIVCPHTLDPTPTVRKPTSALFGTTSFELFL